MTCNFPDCLVEPNGCTCYPPAMSQDVRAIVRDVVPVTSEARKRLADELFQEAMETARRVKHD